MTTPQDLINRDLKVTNVSKYHNLRYTGKGIVFLNAEAESSHQKMTNAVVKRVMPDVVLINGTIGAITKNDVSTMFATISGEKMLLEEAIKKYNIKIINISKSGTTPEATLEELKRIQKQYNIILFCSAGNDGSMGITGIYAKNDTAIAVGAVYVYEDSTISRMHYSGVGEELDFVAPLFGGTGTSASSPGLAAEVGLLLERYGDFTQDECIEVLKSISKDLGAKDRDNSYGYGLPVLPMTDKLEVLEKLRGEKMPDFTDIEETRWSKPAIDRCVAEGLLLGFEDGTFRPTENVTREQFATILTRILDKIEGRI